MRREPRTGQDMSRPSAASRGNRHVGLLEDPLHQPLDRHLRDASHRPQVHSARPQVPNRHVLLQLVPELAPDVQVREPDPTVGEDTGQALNAAENTHVRGGVNHCFHAYLTRPAVDSGPQAWTCSASATVLATRATALYVDSSGLS